MMTAQTATLAHGWFDVLLALLDWPFLLFIFLFAFAFVFRGKITGLLERGDIQIGWGKDRYIKLKELSDGIDEELDPIRDEIQELREQIAAAQGDGGQPASSGIQGERLDDSQREDAQKRMIEALGSPQYRWRSIERLATIAGIDQTDALDILRNNPDAVLGVGKSKRQIARLKDT